MENLVFKSGHAALEYIEKYFDNELNEYKNNILLLFYIKKNKTKKIKEIVNHEIMPKIYKREKLYKIIKKINNSKSEKDKINTETISFFIEKLLIHGYDNIHNKLNDSFNCTAKDLTKKDKNSYIYNYFQIKNKEYISDFEIKLYESEFMRNELILSYL